jgi:hypothetical protein
LQYATGGDPAAIHTISQNLATTAAARVVAQFPNVAARNAGYAADIAAGKLGMMCYCASEDGHCVYRGPVVGWKWLPYDDMLVDVAWVGPALVTGQWPTNPGLALLTSSVVLPGNGLRKIHINASVSVQAYNNAPIQPAMQVFGSGVLYGTVPRSIGAVGDFSKEKITGTWDFTAQGSQAWAVWGVVFGNAYVAQFSEMHLQVFDRGPA